MNQKECIVNTTIREKIGKGSSRLLRRNGQIPAVVYGNGFEPKSIAVSTKDISKRLYNKNFMTTILTMNFDKDSVKVIPKDYQLDPVSDAIIHMDFMRISENSSISVHIPVIFINENKSLGLKQGGNLNVICHEIPLMCAASMIPDSVTVDLSDLKIGDSIHIKDLCLPENTSPVSNMNFTIATITVPTSGS
ncbi:50S ribosomal protein L25/general stress protein Ctc [Candidatus Liberibacter brunswickensis]|uniref:50S ribosomal protein L25/general stress protein Ctc n=1 Tax=Candidatus Liberibacter brunswickensis TaxID=1968796 RepID=UPI002FE3985C